MKKELHTRETPEFLRSRARRDAQCIGQYRWRPTKHDLANLKASTKDPFAYLTMLRAWRLAGFKVNAIRRLANRNPRSRRHRLRGLHGWHHKSNFNSRGKKTCRKIS